MHQPQRMVGCSRWIHKKCSENQLNRAASCGMMVENCVETGCLLSSAFRNFPVFVGFLILKTAAECYIILFRLYR